MCAERAEAHSNEAEAGGDSKQDNVHDREVADRNALHNRGLNANVAP